MNSNFFRYTNQKCPVCEKEFSGEDDIVVCPLCGTPHHRECYKKNGECGNYERHSEGFRWTPVEAENADETPSNENAPQQEENPIFNSQGASATAFFGTGPNPLSLFPKEIEDGIATEEVADHTQLNAFKYIQNFFYLKSKKKPFSWAAFFFAPYWFFYRKMHKLGAIFLALTLLISVGFSLVPPVQKLLTDMTEWTEKYSIENISEFTEEDLAQATADRNKMIYGNPIGSVLIVVQGGLALAIQLVAGFMGNKWYYNHTINSIRKIKSTEPDTQKQKLLFFKAGGVSMSATFLAILANNIVVMAVELLASGIK